MAAVRSTGFARDAIEACLDRISTSPHFARSRRLGRFLRFTVESLLEGRADELKERTIGVEVYGRPLEYDPRTDPIVRSEAHRLRTRLAAYYAREGSADPIVIGYPKGTYVPELRPNRTEPGHGLEGCRVIVAGFEDRSPGGRDAAEAGAMAEALRAHLAGWPGLRVLYRASGARTTPPASAHLEADYRVEGSLERSDDRCALTVRLVRLADEKEISSETQRFAWKRAGEVGEALAEHLAASIGATLTRRASPSARRPVARAHDLYVKGRHSTIQYGNTLDPRHLEPARRRLEAALEREPEYVDALAELAHLELMRLYPPRGDTAHVLASARALLERALDVEPRHARSLYLLGHVEGSALRPRVALRLTESAVAIDPDDPEGRTMLAVRYASLGFWESAVAACDWALALDPVWDAPQRIRVYLLTRMGQLDATRLAIEELARGGTSPTEVAMARFDLRIAEGDVAGARAALASLESTFPLRPDLEDRREIADALAQALQGRRRDARRKVEAHRSDGPRFWDHAIRLALASGEEGLALELLLGNPVNRSYRWLATDALVRPHLHRPRWRALARDLHASWLRDLEEVGPWLPASPPALPDPSELCHGGAPSPFRDASTNPS
jgi:tetratricopeptide (TPR) repeat protein